MKKILYVCLIAAMISFFAICVNDDLSDCIIRLHVVANSDSKEDQELKLKVRDAVLKEVEAVSANADSKARSYRGLKSCEGKIKAVAERVIRENGYSYKVKVEYGRFAFPEKNYGNIHLPSGKYDAVRVTLGSGSGRNWWCVMFPPLCVAEGGVEEFSAMEYLEKNLTPADFEMITDDSVPVIIRFRIVDAAMKVINKLSK